MSKKFAAFLILFLAAGGFFLLPAVRVLSISGRKEPSQVIYSAAACKEGFIISYTHSVNKGRVHDYYRALADGALELYKTQFVSYGAGIPEPEETPGAVFTVTNDGYFIENLERKVPRLVMAVGIVANHSIAAGSTMRPAKEHLFTDYFAPQTSIILEIKRVSLFRYISHRRLKNGHN
ncbi:MAG: DUF1850 domain-containing protein [Treponema sp.]|nr:DUF1850 domain-containing protein [Treponema sp.]